MDYNTYDLQRKKDDQNFTFKLVCVIAAAVVSITAIEAFSSNNQNSPAIDPVI